MPAGRQSACCRLAPTPLCLRLQGSCGAPCKWVPDLQKIAAANHAQAKQLWDASALWAAQWQLFQSGSPQPGSCVPEVMSRWGAP